MTARLPIGTSDFAQLRREGLTYVDKTGLVADVVRSERRVLLFPRPRRFGKTLNLTMLRAYFERSDDDVSAYFSGLSAADAGPDVSSHFQRHPVIYLTFKDVKALGWEACVAGIAGAIGAEVRRHRALWSAAPLDPDELRRLSAVAAEEVPAEVLQQVLGLLSQALGLATGEDVVILIDEYDTPIHAGFARGYYDEVVSFFRNFLSGGLKDNPRLFRGVLTGILRVAKESIFSGLNNVEVHTLISPRFTSRFGFTEDEVVALAALADQPEAVDTLRRWYNGYRVAEGSLYNPWSVLTQLGRPGAHPQAWWVNTASDDILRELLVEGGLGVHAELEALIRGESIRQPISEEIVLRELRWDPSALWSFLLFSGYLTADDPLARDEDGRLDSGLRVPNHEVSVVYRTLFRSWLRRSLPVGSAAPDQLARALLSGDEAGFEALLERLLVTALSFHDTGGRRPEAVYQAFILGLLVHLERSHDVRSNRESGQGRYDVMVRPKAAGQPGAVLELKVLDTRRGETPEQALDRAMAQVQDRRYAAELLAAGASPVWEWAAVFDGKRAWVRAAPGDAEQA